MCEALVIVVWCISDAWEIQQRVCTLMLLAKYVTGEELTHQCTVNGAGSSITSSLQCVTEPQLMTYLCEQ